MVNVAISLSTSVPRHIWHIVYFGAISILNIIILNLNVWFLWRIKLKCTYIRDIPKFPLFSLMSVCRGLEENVIILWLFISSIWYFLVMSLVIFVYSGALNFDENQEHWCSTYKNEFTVNMSKLAIFFKIFIMILYNFYSIIDSEGRLRTKLYDKRENFNVLIVNFPFICSYIPAALAYGVYK